MKSGVFPAGNRVDTCQRSWWWGELWKLKCSYVLLWLFLFCCWLNPLLHLCPVNQPGSTFPGNCGIRRSCRLEPTFDRCEAQIVVQTFCWSYSDFDWGCGVILFVHTHTPLSVLQNHPYFIISHLFYFSMNSCLNNWMLLHHTLLKHEVWVRNVGRGQILSSFAS